MQFTRRLLPASLAALAAVAAVPSLSPATAGSEQPPVFSKDAAIQTDVPAPMAGRLIVTFTDAHPTIGVGMRLAGAEAVSVENRSDRSIVTLDRVLTGDEIDSAVAELAGTEGVVSVEADYLNFPTVLPNDTRLSEQWSLSTTSLGGAVGINAEGAWNQTTGSPNARVAVLDTGFTSHSDLNGKVVSQFDFVADSRIGNDGNGRDPSAADPGDWITFAENAAGFFRGCPVHDSGWHGSHVSGIIAANTNNGNGIAGISWGSKLVEARVLGKCGGFDSDIADAIRWSAGLPVPGAPLNPLPAKIINLSLGGPQPCQPGMQAAVTAAINAGAVVIVAAGNSSSDVKFFSPANCTGVIAVGATDSNGNKPFYSNFGTGITISAPGGGDNSSFDGILSTLNTGTRNPAAETYVRYSGTSMATPTVAGVVALMRSVNPGLSPAQVRQILLSTVQPFPAGSNCISQYACGGGIVDANAAVTLAKTTVSKPLPPDHTSQLAGPNRVNLKWSPPASTKPITDYVVQFRKVTSAAWTTFNDGVNNTPSVTVGGLTNGVKYVFRVAAKSANGMGGFSTAPTVIPKNVPLAPKGLTGTPGAKRVTLKWTAPSSGGRPILDYIVKFRKGTSGAWTTFNDGVRSSTGAVVTGLVTGQPYQFTVSAKTSVGIGWPATIFGIKPK